MIKYEDLTVEQKQIWDLAFELGYDHGWEEGFAEASEEQG